MARAGRATRHSRDSWDSRQRFAPAVSLRRLPQWDGRLHATRVEADERLRDVGDGREGPKSK